jgi:predicted ATPase/DNA-binding SARP family transcriptional activator
MRIALLGELALSDDDGRDIVITGSKQRALLAVLALHAGRAVPTDHLVDALWGEQPPPAVRNGLQGLVSKLRRALGGTDRVAMHGGGYALEVDPSDVDIHRFEQLVGQGRTAADAGDLAAAVHAFSEADALWRGDALAEFAYEEFAAVPIARLTELRLAAAEDRFDAELGLGRHHAVIGDLDALVAAHPLRERPRGLLMTALYRAGRQADALQVYQDGRHILLEELGLEPGPELRQLESAILAQDPSLDPPASSGSRTGSSWDARPSIPASLTPLVGRADELRELGVLFEGCRLLTLVGPGGVGKTRLALELARAQADGMADGACLVELAPIGDPAGVRMAVTSALDLPDPNRLAEHIGTRELLLVLDNCEHVIATAAEVAEDLLRRCPNLRLVATSREGLRVGGETIWPVPPLAVDDAAELFADRARAAGGRLDAEEPQGDVASAIAEICRRLDGLPLAIELAAARTRAFPLPQLVTRLNDRFRLLTGGSRTALPRQQTLRAVVDWSYELLFEDEQRVFERLSVFPGGCDLATAEAVCADETLPAADLEDLVHALVEKSLVVVVPGGDVLRVRQLQTLAQYGREKLAERGESERVRDAMAAHFAQLCAGSAAAFVGDEQRSWLVAIDREQDNLRGALEWAVANDDAETALTIAGGASWPHWLAGTTVEGKRWLDEAFGCRGEASDSVRALGLVGRGVLGFQLGRTELVDSDLREALRIFRSQGDVASQALTYSFYAEVAAARGDHDEARTRRLEVLDFYRAQPDDPFVIAARSYSEGKLGLLDGDLERSERAYRSSLEGFERIDRPMMAAMCAGMVADFDERAGAYGDAASALSGAVATSDALGLRGFLGALLARLGWDHVHLGDLAAAGRCYDRALELGRRLGNTPVVFSALTGTAVLHRLEGRNDAAAAAAAEALDLYERGGPRRLANRVDPEADLLASAAACCGVLAGVALDAGEAGESAALLERAATLASERAAPLPLLLHDDIARTRDALGAAVPA